MKKLIILFLFLPVFANASNWILVSKSTDGDSYYLDSQSIMYNGNEVSYWAKVNYKSRNKFGDLSSKEQWAINCRTRESNLLYMNSYSDFDNRGTTTGSYKAPADWRPIAPDSIAEEILKFVCKKR